jgi:hypothetical protein
MAPEPVVRAQMGVPMAVTAAGTDKERAVAAEVIRSILLDP